MADRKLRPAVPESHPNDVEHRRLLAQRANSSLPKDGSIAMENPLLLKSYTVATLPSASLWTGGLVYVSDETGGAVPCFSDGTNWRRLTDRVIAS